VALPLSTDFGWMSDIATNLPATGHADRLSRRAELL